jgi:hypothetical protein
VINRAFRTGRRNWDDDVVPLAIFAEGDVFGEMTSSTAHPGPNRCGTKTPS